MISVIIPVYNREKTIAKSINSVLNQTYDDIELLLIDDGSTDNSRDIIKNINDPRIKYVYQENAGACAARNHGIDLANGEYIAFHDSDDTWRKEKLMDQLETLNEIKADICFGQMKIGEKIVPSSLKEGFVSQLDFLKYPNLIGTPTIFGKASCFKTVKFDPLMPRLQDREIAIRLSKSFKVYFKRKVYVDVDEQENSISRNNYNGIAALERIIDKNEDVLNENPDIKNELLNSICYFKKLENIDCTAEYKEMLKNSHNIKTIVKYLTYKLIPKRKRDNGY